MKLRNTSEGTLTKAGFDEQPLIDSPHLWVSAYLVWTHPANGFEEHVSIAAEYRIYPIDCIQPFSSYHKSDANDFDFLFPKHINESLIIIVCCRSKMRLYEKKDYS